MKRNILLSTILLGILSFAFANVNAVSRSPEGRRVIFKKIKNDQNRNHYLLNQQVYFNHQLYRLDLSFLENPKTNAYLSDDYMVRLENRTIQKEKGFTTIHANLDSAGHKSRLLLIYDHNEVSGVLYGKSKMVYITGKIGKDIQMSQIKDEFLNNPNQMMLAQNSIPAPILLMLYESMGNNSRNTN